MFQVNKLLLCEYVGIEPSISSLLSKWKLFRLVPLPCFSPKSQNGPVRINYIDAHIHVALACPPIPKQSSDWFIDASTEEIYSMRKVQLVFGEDVLPQPQAIRPSITSALSSFFFCT